MSAETLGLGALAVALLAAFVVLEARLRHPLIRLGIFRMRSITGANAAMLLVAGGMFAMFYFASIYVQEVLGYSALRAGLAFLPVTAGIIAGAGLSQQLIRRVGVRAVGLTGMSIAAVGLIVLSRIPGGRDVPRRPAPRADDHGDRHGPDLRPDHPDRHHQCGAGGCGLASGC